MEKLFTMIPSANHETIRIKLADAQELTVNESGELVAETELGAVKFTKPVAYQEIDGQRVEVECNYTIAEWVKNLDFGIWNLDCFTNSAFRIPQFRNWNTVYGSLLRQDERPLIRPPPCIHLPGRGF